MLHKEELRKQVIQYFRSVGSGENIVQCIKEALFLHQRFSPVMLFDVLSKGKQKLTQTDIRNYLLDHNIHFSEEQFRYYCGQNGFKSQITLNEFLEAMIPFNADVVRQFKAKYLQALEIRDFDPEVEFILSELYDNEFKFIRSLLTIREEITKIATRKQIETLIKEDLVLQSKPREARKFHQSFQVRNFELGFHQLRKFLQIWLSSKEIIHQFYLLNVMRHLKSSNPFEKIVLKRGRSKSKNQSIQRRSFSAKQGDQVQLTNQKVRERITQQNEQKYEGNAAFFSGNKSDKYNNFKQEVMNDFIREKQGLGKTSNEGTTLRGRKEQEQRFDQSHGQVSEQLKRSKYQRDAKGIDGRVVVQILQEMVIKEERLEKLRKTLAKLNDFNLINLFKLIDQRGRGSVNSRDISDFSQVGKVQFNHLVNFYARQPEHLRFHEFCLIFRPLSKQLNELIDSRQQHKVPNPFKKDTMKIIIQVLTLTAEMHSNLDSARRRINQGGISVGGLFRFVDLQEKGYISASCLQRVLSQNNVFCDDRDLKCLMKLFRKKVDERISPQEFIDFISL